MKFSLVVTDWLEWGFLVLFLGVLSWPLWREGMPGVEKVGVRIEDVLGFLPSLAMAMGFYWEIVNLPLLSIVVLKICSGFLCFASCLSRGVTGLELWLYPPVLGLVALFILLSPRRLGRCVNSHDKIDFHFELMKFLILAVIAVATAVTISFVRQGEFWGEFIIQVFPMISLILIALLCICLPGEVEYYGLGTPMLGLGIRILLSVGVRTFWAFGVLCMIAFVMLNWGSEGKNVYSLLKDHWRRWQNIQNSNGIILLCTSIAIGALCVNNYIAVVSLGGGTIDQSLICSGGGRWLKMLSNVTFVQSQSWSVAGRDRLQKYISDEIFHSCHMSAHDEIITVTDSSVFYSCLLVLISSCAMTCLQGIYDRSERRSIWLPISFFSVGASLVLATGSDEVELRRFFGSTTVVWSEEFIMALFLCITGGLISASLLVFKVMDKVGGSGSLLLMRSDESCAEPKKAKGKVDTRWSLLIPFMAIAAAALVSFITPMVNEGNPSIQSRFCDDASGYYPRWSSLTYDGSTAAQMELKILGGFVPEGANTTYPIGTLGLSVPQWTDLMYGLELMQRDRRSRGFNHTLEFGQWFRADDFGPSLLAKSLTVIVGVADVLALVCVFGSLWYPILDDLALGFLGCAAVIMSVGYPSIIGIVRRVTLSGCSKEYPFSWMLILQICVHIIAIMLLVRERMLELTRVRCPEDKCHYGSVDELRAAYCQCTDVESIEEFAEQCGIEGFHGTLEELFNATRATHELKEPEELETR